MKMRTLGLFIATAVFCVGCLKSGMGTETGNPPLVTPGLLAVDKAGDDRVTVRGEAGAITPGGGEVAVRNLTREGKAKTAEVAEDGSFQATLPGALSDAYEVVASNAAGSAGPQVVSPDPGGPDWQTLHLCDDDDPMDPLDVTELRIQGDTLHVSVAHAGGCAQHTYGLCYGAEWAESFPIQVRFTVLHDAMGDSCEALEHADLDFDLGPFRKAYADAYLSDEGAASLGFDDCALEGADPGGCSVLYEWPESTSNAPLALPDPPASWSVRQTECGFSLSLPDDLVEEDVQGIDSCVASFVGEACILRTDAGWASDTLDDVAGASTRLGTVNGREARLITAQDEDEQRPHTLGIHFFEVSDSPGSTTLFGRCESEAARDALLPALGSVRFD